MPNDFSAGRGMNAQELTRLGAAIAGTYYFPASAGGAVTPSSGLTLSIAAIALGTVVINGTLVVTGYAGGTDSVATADPDDPRIDTVVFQSDGTVDIVTGTPVAVTATTGPTPPVISSTQIAIADIYVAAGATSIVAGNITDRRQANAPPVFNGIRNLFRANRRLVAEFSAAMPSSAQDSVGTTVVGTGFTYYVGTASYSAFTQISGEPIARFSSAGASGPDGIGPGVAGNTASLSPDHSPRMLLRVQLPAAGSDLTRWHAGFFSANNTSTANGAYIRILTTGNAFFVTRQGSSETTFDMGTLSRTAILGYEIESPDAGVTWVLRNQAGTVLASHTTNVPTAGTALVYGVTGTMGNNTQVWGISYCRVEGTFA